MTTADRLYAYGLLTGWGFPHSTAVVLADAGYTVIGAAPVVDAGVAS